MATKAIAKPREKALTLIGQLGSNVSYDDIMYNLYVLQKIEKGDRDIAEGKVFTVSEAKVRLKKWLK